MQFAVASLIQAMQKIEKFRVRPGYKSKEILVEFRGDHRAGDYPDIGALLGLALGAKSEKHPDLDAATIALATDRIISYWVYAGGVYEMDDDVDGCFITARANNARVIGDIERALLDSGLFVKEEVDFGDYA